MKEGNLSHIRHFIWDFDGTLLDTYPTIIGFLRSALQEYGYDCDETEAMKLMLCTIATARDHYADLYGIDRKELLERYMHYHRERTPLLPAKPFAGVQEVLRQICQSGGYHYIYTHRDDTETVRYLEKYGLRQYFREIVGSTSPHFAPKPSPDSVSYLMEKYGMTAENAVLVGDRDCDLESARNAGIGTVHLLCPVASQQLECTWQVSNFAEMLTLIG